MGLCTQDPLGLSNEHSCEAGGFSCHLKPQRFFQSEVLRLHFPTLEPWVLWSVSLRRCSSGFICTQIWDRPVCQLPPCCVPSPLRLPISTPPTGLNECVFFISLVIRLPYSSNSWQFWLLFVFKSVVVFLLVVRGGKVYPPTPLSWVEVPYFYPYFAFIFLCN